MSTSKVDNVPTYLTFYPYLDSNSKYVRSPMTATELSCLGRRDSNYFPWRDFLTGDDQR